MPVQRGRVWRAAEQMYARLNFSLRRQGRLNPKKRGLEHKYTGCVHFPPLKENTVKQSEWSGLPRWPITYRSGLMAMVITQTLNKARL